MGRGFRYIDSRGVSRLVSEQLDPHAVLAAEIGPAYAAYRRRWDEARTYQNQPAFPLHVDYEMKFRCNLRCPMCLMSLGPEGRRRYGDPAQELSPETVMELIAEGVGQGQRAMGFGGLWEPLLSPDLPEIVARGRALGLVDVMFNTNGFLLTEETGRALIEGGLTRLMISLDAATAETYGKMRVGSDFGTVVANIENFLALKRRLGRNLPLVRLSFCRTALNAHELDAFIERWDGLADFFSIQAYGRFASASPPEFAPGSTALAVGRCAQPHKRLLVRHNGDVTPCCDASGAGLVMGNISNDSLGEIWRGKTLADLRLALAESDFTGQAETCLACQTKFGDLELVRK